MKRMFVSLFCGIACVSLAMGQQPPPKGYTTVIPLQGPPADASFQPIISVSPLPMWTYSINASAALGGGTYTGKILGRSPFDRGKTTTTIPLQIIPLVITINDTATGTHTYDPTAVDSCITPGSHSVVDVITGSPILTNNNWTMNGVAIGNTQYEDAVQRAQFWSLVGGTPYHLLLNPTVLAPQSMLFKTSGGGLGSGTNYNAVTEFGACGFVGVVNINDMDAALQSLITGPLAALVNAGTFPVFLTQDVVMATSGTDIFSHCCVLGFHSAFTAGPNIQVYSPFSIDTDGLFGGGFTNAFSHEIGEAINDPTTNNPTPPWGNIGQVQNACQNNFETGDPLSPGFGTPTNSFSVLGANGLTYSLQELAFFNWFYGGTSLGAGGKYSDNGTFSGSAKLCPPGGTN